MKKLNIVTIFFACLLVAALAYSQGTPTGNIYGKITDEQDAVLPGVTVSLDNPSISTHTFTSTNLGVYRFVQLAPGNYQLTFELSGFQTQVMQDIRVTIGNTTTVNVVMKMATVEEAITVKSELPVVNPKKTGVTVDVSQEILANIPSARDPWVIMDQIGGVWVDRVNVGGSESGQQSYFSARGTPSDQGMWNVDGIAYTDMAAAGSSMAYYDFDSFEEIQFTTAGGDPSIHTAGVSISFITKQGGDNFRGQFSFYGTTQSFQSDNRTQEMKDAGYYGNKIDTIRDYGFDVGGPIVKGKLWFWGAYGVQDINLITILGTTDATWLEQFNIKFHGQVTDNDKVTVFFNHANKVKKGRGAGPRRPSDTTFDQQGPTPVYKIELQHIFNENFLITANYGDVGGGFELMPKGGEVQTSYDYDTRMWGRSYWYYITERPQKQVIVNGNYYLEEAAGGDHEFKFGFEYKNAVVTSLVAWQANAVAVFDAGVPTEAWLNPEQVLVCESDYISFYLGDTFTKGRLTLNLGFRYDQQKSINPAAEGPAHPFASDMLPAIRISEIDPGYRWKDFSPRIGFTYDLTGDGKTLLRGSYNRYGSQLPDWYASHISPLNWREIDYEWNDANGDTFVQLDELLGYPNNPIWWDNVDLANPTAASSPNRVGSDLAAPKTDEIIFGVEREVMPQFSMGANFIYRRRSKTVAWFENDVTSADWSPFTYADPDYPQYTVTYYTLNFTCPSGTTMLNTPDYWEHYMAFELTWVKRLSNKWMMNGAFTYQDNVTHYDSASSYTDPTNVDALNNAFPYIASWGSGKSDIWVGAKWMFKLSGLYQLPHGFNVSGFFNARQGYSIPQSVYVSASTRGQGVGGIQVITDPFGSIRLPTFYMFDFRLEKAVDMGSAGHLSLMLDIFNIFNVNTTLGEERQKNSSNFKNIYEIVNPRVIRIGARVRF